jgi:hypothetical protein
MQHIEEFRRPKISTSINEWDRLIRIPKLLEPKVSEISYIIK